MTYSTVEYSITHRVGIVKLNRPERMNAVIEEMYLEIQDIVSRAAEDTEVRSMILTGSEFKRGDVVKQAFCAGADLKKHSSGQRSPAEQRSYILLAHETTRRLYEFPKPVIAAVNGPARGAGAEMALSCDFIFMAETATLAFPETGLGTFVGGGVTSILPAIVGITVAKELIYTGRLVDGKAAARMGLALRCTPLERLLDECLAFAGELAEKAPLSLRLAKKRLQGSSRMDLETVLLLEAEDILSCMRTEDWLEGNRSFSEKRKPIFTGK